MTWTPRAALAGTLSFSGGVAAYTADAGDADNLTVALATGPTRILFSDPGGVTAGAGATQEGANAASISSAAVFVNVDLGDMDDFMDASASPIEAVVMAGAGDDTVIANQDMASMDGGSGNDSFLFVGTAAADTISFAAVPTGGFDATLVRTAPFATTIDLVNTETIEIDVLDGNDNVNTANAFNGAVANVIVDGGLGNDTLTGGAGNDTLIGGPGADTIDGGDGDDTIAWFDGDGNDTLNGGNGNDTFEANADPVNADTMTAMASGANVLLQRTSAPAFTLTIATFETIRVNTLGGDDSITLGNLGGTSVTAFEANGGGGNDTLDASGETSGAVAVTLNGDAGDDILNGGGAADTLNGGDGNDSLDGNAGADVMNGGADDDDIVWNNGDGSDFVTGGAGTDTFVFNGNNGGADDILVEAGGSEVELSRGGLLIDINTTEILEVNPLAGDDTVEISDTLAVTSVTSVTVNGGDGNDSLTGGAGVETLNGDAGDDFLDGNGGADFLNGGDGDDTIEWNNGDGSDFVSGDAGADTFTFNGNPGGTDTITVNPGGSEVLLVRGGLTIDVNTAETFNVNPLAGDDSVTIGDLTGTSVTAMTVNGGDGNDSLTGGAGVETLNGGAGDDFLDGNGGADTLNGGDGDDTIVWDNGDGSDFVRGDAGSDTFTFNGDNGGVDDIMIGAGGSEVLLARGGLMIDINTTETINVNPLAGDDIVAVGDLSATNVATLNVDGGDGDDDLMGGPGADILNGGAGDDTLQGNGGADIMNGGDGSDTFVWNNGDGPDDIFGGADFDFFNFNGADGPGDDISLQAGATLDIDLERFAPTAFVIETDELEAIRVFGLGGNDLLTIEDLSFSPTLAAVGFFGGDGDDFLDATATQAPLAIDAFGDAGNDILLGGGGDDALIGDDGMGGADGDDIIDGGAGDDFSLGGGMGDDLIFGGPGDETLVGGDGDDELVGGPGSDVLAGNAGDDLLIWNNGDGSDTFEGSAGNDIAQVNASPSGDDAFSATANGTRFDFARTNFGPFSLDIGGVETLDFNGLGGSETLTIGDLTGVADLALIDADGADGDEVFDASAQDNSAIAMNFFGGNGDDSLDGGAGVDLLDGGPGNDFLRGNRGGDIMDGGDGDDTFEWNNGDGPDFISGQNDADTFNFFGSDPGTPDPNDDILIDAGGSEVELERFLPTAFVIDINTVETINVDALSGADTVAVGDLSGTNVATLNVNGGDDDDDIQGGPGVDTLNGGPGDDTITGNGGDDIMNGGDGDDTFIWNGGDANDAIDGGNDFDTFQFNGSNANADEIEVFANLPGAQIIRTTPTMITIDVVNLEAAHLFGQGGDDLLESHDDLTGTSVEEVGLFGGDGDDLLDGTGTVAASILADGGAGVDDIFGGDEADDLSGGDGDDFIQGNRGGDAMNGDAGADLMVWNNGDGPDFVSGGDDLDTFEFNGADPAADVLELRAGGTEMELERFAPSAFTIDINTTETVNANLFEGDNSLTVQDLTGTLLTLLDVTVGAGNDTLDATNQDNNAVSIVMLGGDGDDTLIGGAGNDTLQGEGGNDFIQGGGSGETLLGGPGDDSFVWNNGDGPDFIDGEGGTDDFTFNGSGGGDDNVALRTGGFFAEIELERTLPSAFFIDIDFVELITINGLGGSDTIAATGLGGTSLTDLFLNGNSDGDVLNATGLDSGVPLIADGGPGNDNIFGGPDADTLLGSGDDDFIRGNGGADDMQGGGGDDTFEWNNGDGPDVIDGMGGFDSFVFNGSNGSGDVVEIRPGGSENELERFAPSAFVIDLQAVELMDVNGLGGDDLLTALDMAGTSVEEVGLFGGAGMDTLDATALGTTIDALLDGGPGDDTLLGGSGNDLMSGGSGDDFLQGFLGGDVKIGDAGADFLLWNNGDGPDIMIGGDDFDTFEFNGADGPGDDVVIGPGEFEAQLERFAPTAFVIGIEEIERVDLNPLAGDDTFALDDLTGTFIEEINFDGSDGADSFDGSGQLNPDTDLVLLGGPEDDVLIGSPGDDFIEGGTGDDTMAGGDGDDTLVWNNGDGSDLIDGDGGSDLLRVTGANAGGDDFLVSPNAPRFTLERTNLGLFSLDVGGVEELNLFGRGGDDNMTVLDLPGVADFALAVFIGDDGDDTLDASALSVGPAFRAYGSDGDDTLIGGPQSDILEGGLGVDNIDGAAGDDLIVGGQGGFTVANAAGANVARYDAESGSFINTFAGDAAPAGNGFRGERAPGDSTLTINLTTDDFAGETSWEIVDDNTTMVVATSPDYTGSNNTFFTEDVTLPCGGDYTFTIFDSFGDGICCLQGNGDYELVLDGSQIATGGAFLDEESTSFSSMACPMGGGGLTGGPDSFGYVFADSNATGGPAYDFVDISGSGTDLGFASDDPSSTQSLGFTFNFYGNDFTDVTVSANGYLTFGSDGTDFSVDAIPTATDPNDLVALFWDDLHPGEGGSVFVETQGTSPDQVFIVQFDNVDHRSEGVSSGRFQAKLFEGSNAIEFHYETATGDPGPTGDAGGINGHTIGLENGDGSVGLEYTSGDATDLPANLAIRFDPPAAMAPTDNPLVSPENMVYGPNGDLYVADPGAGAVLHFDGDTSALLGQLDSSSGLSAPSALDFGPDGNLYVADDDTGAVLRFDGMTAAFIDEFIPAGTLGQPNDMRFGPDGLLYIADGDTDQVARHDEATGAFVDVIDPATLSGGLSNPEAVAFDAAGNVYVADSGNGRVALYDAVTGAYASDFATDFAGGAPWAMAFDTRGNLYVASHIADDVRSFDGATGDLLDVVVASGTTALTPTAIAFRGGLDGGDVLVGGPGSDQIFGDEGDDSITWNNGDGSDFIEGGFGANDEVTVNGSPTMGDEFQGMPVGDRTLFERTNFGPFQLDMGTIESLVVNGLGGDDIIDLNALTEPVPTLTADGGDGDDQLFGSPGADTLNGGNGNDTIQGNQGADLMNGDAGDDLIIWNNGDGPDDVTGGDDQDTFEFNGSMGAGDVIDLVLGTTFEVNLVRTLPTAFTIEIDTTETLDVNTLGGDDTVRVADLNGTSVTLVDLDGADGDDFLDAQAVPSGAVAVAESGGDGDDTLFGSGNAETIDGGAGDDFIDGGQGNDTLIGGDGDDRLVWNNGDGSDSMFGGAGLDRVDVNGSLTQGDNFNVSTDGLGTLLFDRLNLGLFTLDILNVEELSVRGQGGNDTLTVQDLPGVIDLALVRLEGGDGDDVLDSSALTLATIVFEAFGGSGNDLLIGGDLADRLEGGRGVDVIDGAAGDDLLVGDRGGFVLANIGDVPRFDGESGSFINAFVGSLPGFGIDLAYTPDGKDLLVSDGVRVSLFDGDTGALLEEEFADENFALFPTGLAFGPDGNLYVIAGAPQEVLRFDGTTGAFIDTFVTPGAGAFSAATELEFGPNGNLYVVDGGNDHVAVFAGTNGARVGTLTGGLSDPFGLELGPDGLLYVADNGNQRIVRFDPADGSLVDTFALAFDPGNGPIDMAFGPDGSLYATVGDTFGGASEVRRYDLAGDLLDIVASAPEVDQALGIAFAPFSANDHDEIVGGPGADRFFGDNGDDLMVWNNGDGSDFMEGGFGEDRTQVNGSNNAATGDHFQATPNGDRILFERTNFGLFQLDIGTTESIEVNGNDGDDIIDFSGIVDEISLSANGGAGDDIINGTQITDEELIGGPGDDQIFGEDGDETFVYNDGDGNDLLEGGPGSDRLIVNGSNNAATGDIFLATANLGRVLFQRTNLVPFQLDLGTIEVAEVNGRDGGDTIDFSAIVDEITLEADGGAGNDTIRGTQSSDLVLIGGPDDDMLFGNDGDETFIWLENDGSDTVDGGAGFDRMVVFGAGAAPFGLPRAVVSDVIEVLPNGTRFFVERLNLTPFTLDIGTTEQLDVNGGAGDDTVTVFDLTGVLDLQIANMAGDEGNDAIDASGLLAGVTLTLLGGEGDDLLFAGQGDDFVDGGPGADDIVGNPGNDDLNGGDGFDTITWNNGDGSDVIDGDGGTDTVIVNGSMGSADFFVGTANGARLTFRRANLGMFALDIGTSENLVVNSGGGNDNVVINDLTGVADLATVSLDGGDGNDLLDGSGLTAGVSFLAFGGAGNDNIRGGAGDDALDGDDGDDFIQGNRGDDQMIGGAGDDSFVWNNGDGSDTIDGNDDSDDLTVNGSPTSGDLFFVVDNGGRVSFERANLGLFALDIGTVESLTVNGLGGDDLVIADDVSGAGLTELALNGGDGVDLLDASSLSAGMFLTATGGDGEDTLLGGESDDTLIGSAGNDIVTGNGGDDLLVWNNGDGSDLMDGGDGEDELQVNGSTAEGDLFEVSGDGAGFLFSRTNLGLFTLTVSLVESLEVNSSNGDDELALNDLSGSDLASVSFNPGAGHDTGIVNASAGDDVFDVSEAQTTLGGLAFSYSNNMEELRANGEDGDDLFMVTASRFAVIRIDGGDHPVGDSLDLDAEGLRVLDQTPTSVTLEGRQTVFYFNIEMFDLLNIGIGPSGIVIR